MDSGWIKLYRKSLDSQVFADAELWKLWTWILLKANHKKKWVLITTGKGQKEVEVSPGQLIFGRKKCAIELNMKPKSLYNRIKKLEKLQNVAIKVDTHYSLITVLNFDTYNTIAVESGQPCGHPKDTQRTTKGQPMDTTKNQNKKDNQKNQENTLAASLPESLPIKKKKKPGKKTKPELKEKDFNRILESQEELELLQEKTGLDTPALKYSISRIRDYCIIHDKWTYKDIPAVIRQWNLAEDYNKKLRETPAKSLADQNIL